MTFDDLNAKQAVRHRVAPRLFYALRTCLFCLLFLLPGMSMVRHLAQAAELPQQANDTRVSRSTHVPKEIQRLHVEKFINAVAWSADGSRLAALSNFGGTITLWETKHWTKLKEFKRYSGAYAFNSLEFLPDGTLLTATPGGDYSKDPRYAHSPLADPHYNRIDIWSLMQWNPETGEHVRYLPDRDHLPKGVKPSSVGTTNTFTVSRDKSLIAGINSNGKGVSIIDARSGRLLRLLTIPPMPTHPDREVAVALSPDNQELAVGTSSGMVYFYSVLRGDLVNSLIAFPTGEYSCNALAFSPDGRFIAIGKYKNLNVREPNDLSTYIWRVTDGKLIASLPGALEPVGSKEEASPVRAISWNPAGDMVAVGDSGSLRVWRFAETGQSLLVSKHIVLGAYSVSYSPQGALAAVDNNAVVIYQP